MKQSIKIIFLILVFVLPLGVFVFLKLFGRNEFDVAPLYVSDAPPKRADCDLDYTLPYLVPDSVKQSYNLLADSLTVIFLGPLTGEGQNQLDRVREQTTTDHVQIIHPAKADRELERRCIFLLDSGMDVVMLDRRGAIRGHYTAADRDEMDRLLTEITIILKKY